MASRNRCRGTRVPISMRPSAAGRVSSNTESLVKLRMAKLSSHLMGHGSNLPPALYSTTILREYIVRSPLSSSVYPTFMVFPAAILREFPVVLLYSIQGYPQRTCPCVTGANDMTGASYAHRG